MKTQHCLILIFWLCTPFFLSAQADATGPSKTVIVLEDGTAFEGVYAKWDTTVISLLVDGEILTLYTDKIVAQFPSSIISNSLDEGKESFIILKDKKWLKAHVLEVSQKFLLVENEEGRLKIPLSNLFKIYPSGLKFDHSQASLHSDESYLYKPLSSFVNYALKKEENKIYNITYGQFIYRFAEDDRSFFRNDRKIDGLGVQHVVGYRLSNFLGLGVNLGFANYQVDGGFSDFIDCFNCFGSSIRNVNVLSTGLSIRGDLNQNKVRPYYNIDFGFNKPLRNQNVTRDLDWFELNFEQEFNKEDSGSELGILFQPSVGIQFTLKSFDLLIDLGYQYTNLNYENGDFRFDDDLFHTVKGRKEIRNFVLRLGMKL